MPGQIFISYRRDDAAYVTGHINDRLCREFGAESIFTDVDNIALGVDFRSVLDEKVGQCQILLAVIGDHWLTAKSEEGELRLHDPADFVRIEIESALKRKIPVIPLLVGGTKMPSKDDLPESLQDLSFRNGTKIRPVPDFHADIDRLIHSLKRHLQTVSAETNDVKSELSTDNARGRDEQNQESIVIESAPGPQHENDQRDLTATNVIPEDDERARHQTELARHHKKKRRAAFVFRALIVVLVAVAGASWYFEFDYEQQFETTIAAMTASHDVEPLVDVAAQTQSETDDTTIFESTVESLATVELEADAVANFQPYVNATTESESISEPDTVTEGQSEAEPAAEVDGTTDAAMNPEADVVADTQAQTEANARVQSEAVAEAQLKLDATAAFREGISLAAIGNHEAAVLSYDAAIPLIADPAFVHKQRGVSYHALGEYEAAIKDFGEAIQLNAEDANAYFNRGVAYHELGDDAAAITNFDEAIRLDPEFASAFYNRGSSHEALGDHEAAERDHAAAAELRSGPIDAD
jgi:Flp pilus assembly protein TadD